LPNLQENLSVMNFAVCPLSIVPVRASGNDKSEMLTQLLFGECVEILHHKGKQWFKVRCLNDNTIGWVSTNQLQAIMPSEQETFRNYFAFSLEFIQPIMSADMSRPITIGARLPDFDGMRCTFGEKDYTFSGQAVFPKDLSPSAELIIKFARRYLHAPYLSGGRSPFGIDAGALVQLVFSFVGIVLHRYPEQQVEQGRTVDFVQQAQAGDIAFFQTKNGNITHTGILLPDNKIIHSYGQVRIDRIDHYGIYNEDLKKYTHKLRIVRRFLEKIPERLPEIMETDVVPENQIGLF
jgi:cell wall-associated NlpC family hydrolase